MKSEKIHLEKPSLMSWPAVGMSNFTSFVYQQTPLTK